MKRRIAALLLQYALLTAFLSWSTHLQAAAKARSHIICGETVITELRFPTGPSGAQAGYFTFANKHEVTVIGETPPPWFDAAHWEALRVGDRVMTCVNEAPVRCRHHIMVIDYDANVMFDGFQGPEGAC